MRILGKKAVESPQRRGRPPLASDGWELRSQTPDLLLSPTFVAFVKCVSSVERTLLLPKNNRSNTQ